MTNKPGGSLLLSFDSRRIHYFSRWLGSFSQFDGIAVRGSGGGVVSEAEGHVQGQALSLAEAGVLGGFLEIRKFL